MMCYLSVMNHLYNLKSKSVCQSVNYEWNREMWIFPLLFKIGVKFLFLWRFLYIFFFCCSIGHATRDKIHICIYQYCKWIFCDFFVNVFLFRGHWKMLYNLFCPFVHLWFIFCFNLNYMLSIYLLLLSRNVLFYQNFDFDYFINLFQISFRTKWN